MKKLFLLTAAGILSLSVFAGENHPEKYCAKMKDGKLTVMHQGYPLTSSVTLNDGSMIKMDASITKKDGSIVMLRENQCVDKDGKIVNEEMKKDSRKKY